MFIAERHDRIMKLIRERGRVKVSQLGRMFNVSEATIRSDLMKLERAGVLRRTHGGAISIGEDFAELSFKEKEGRNIEEKRRIANAAVRMIDDGDNIILDAGTTTLQIARALRGAERRNVRVITNSIYNALELIAAENIFVTIVGGDIRRHSRSIVGPLSLKTLEGLHANKLFLGTTGASLHKGLTSPNMIEAQTKHKMIEAANEVVLVADHTKFGNIAYAPFASFEEIDVVITGKELSNEFVEPLSRMGIKMVLV
ncbi:MAG: DeoR/GlpR family DNA-binding transcription regulator [bacterium]